MLKTFDQIIVSAQKRKQKPDVRMVLRQNDWEVREHKSITCLKQDYDIDSTMSSSENGKLNWTSLFP